MVYILHIRIANTNLLTRLKKYFLLNDFFYLKIIVTFVQTQIIWVKIT